MVQIQPRRQQADHEDSTSFTRQHELDYTDQKYVCAQRSRSLTVVGIGDMSAVHGSTGRASLLNWAATC